MTEKKFWDPNTPESVKILHECVDLQLKKSQDYQNPNSNVRQADHYRRGVGTIHDMIWQKLLRAQSLIEAAEQGHRPNFESLEDTYKDVINYASFAVSYARGRMQGQDPKRDFLNRVKTVPDCIDPEAARTLLPMANTILLTESEGKFKTSTGVAWAVTGDSNK